MGESHIAGGKTLAMMWRPDLPRLSPNQESPALRNESCMRQWDAFYIEHGALLVLLVMHAHTHIFCAADKSHDQMGLARRLRAA
eukprot:6152113-Amphidinium_carterae.3